MKMTLRIHGSDDQLARRLAAAVIARLREIERAKAPLPTPLVPKPDRPVRRASRATLRRQT